MIKNRGRAAKLLIMMAALLLMIAGLPGARMLTASAAPPGSVRIPTSPSPTVS